MRELEFHYFSPKGESFRCIEPYFLIFRWSSWYVWGFCKTRSDFRLFKLNRMENLRLNGMEFAKRNAPMPNFSLEQIFPGAIKVKALFHAECKWRLIDEYGPDCFTEQPDGTLLFQADYTDRAVRAVGYPRRNGKNAGTRVQKLSKLLQPGSLAHCLGKSSI